MMSRQALTEPSESVNWRSQLRDPRKQDLEISEVCVIQSLIKGPNNSLCCHYSFTLSAVVFVQLHDTLSLPFPPTPVIDILQECFYLDV